MTTDADKILIVATDPPHPSYVAHLELQSKYKPDDNERFLVYNILVGRHANLLVRTVVFLLRREADGDGMRRPLLRAFPGEPPYLEFHFRVVRVWEQPVELFLNAGIGLLPLAPLGKVTRKQMPGVIRQMKQRIDTEAPDQAPMLWSATYILLGLRYPSAFAEQLLQGVRDMEESATYQAILQKGRISGIEQGVKQGIEQGVKQGVEKGKEIGLALGERHLLLRLGTQRFGAPSIAEQSQIEQITSVEQLEQLADRLLKVQSWAELLA